MKTQTTQKFWKINTETFREYSPARPMYAECLSVYMKLFFIRVVSDSQKKKIRIVSISIYMWNYLREFTCLSKCWTMLLLCSTIIGQSCELLRFLLSTYLFVCFVVQTKVLNRYCVATKLYPFCNRSVSVSDDSRFHTILWGFRSRQDRWKQKR